MADFTVRIVGTDVKKQQPYPIAPALLQELVMGVPDITDTIQLIICKCIPSH